MYNLKRIESLLRIADMKFDFQNLRDPFSQTSGFVPGRKTVSVNAASVNNDISIYVVVYCHHKITG